MKLYYAPGTCSQACHIALTEAGLGFELEKVAFGMPHRTETGLEYTSINPKGCVPALQLDDGSLLTENAVILQYIADRAPATHLAPAAGTMERYRVMEWLNYISGEVHRNFSPLFQPGVPDDYKPLARAAVEKRYDHIEKALGDKPFLTGTDFSVADAYLFVTLGWAAFLGWDFSRWPRLAAFRERVASRAAVRQVLQSEGMIPA